MAPTESILRALREWRARFGVARTLKHAAFRFVNRLMYLDCLHIILLKRENLKPLDPGNGHRLSARIATLQDLEKMQTQGCWEIQPKKMGLFAQGDVCLLSYVDDRLAGYTWVHTQGCPELVPGLRLSVPRDYVYNFAAFTLPEYRGYGLQSFRHHELLHHPRWQDRSGLLGFVIHTNYSSMRGQDKSGYTKMGDIWLVGTKSHFCALMGKNLRSMGIHRIRPSSRPPHGQ